MSAEPIETELEATFEEEISQPGGFVQFLRTTFSLPVVGDWLSTGALLLPMFLMVIVTGENPMEGPGLTIVTFVATFAWLLILERTTAIAICLPIPVINIKWRWVLPLLLVVMLAA